MLKQLKRVSWAVVGAVVIDHAIALSMNPKATAKVAPAGEQTKTKTKTGADGRFGNGVRRQSIKELKIEMNHVTDDLMEGIEPLYPMWALPIKHLLELKGTLPDHQTLIKEKKLVNIDEISDKKKVIFVSHQWLSWDGPDPNFHQFSLLQEAIELLRNGQPVTHTPVASFLMALGKLFGKTFESSADFAKGLPEILQDCYVWYDFFCIAQPTSKLANDDTIRDLNLAVCEKTFLIKFRKI